jgi:hypothetical integral membrane protein (TIGR02206 family)
MMRSAGRRRHGTVRHLSPEHLAALAATATASGAAVWAARRDAGAWAVPASRALAVAILAAYLTEAAAYALRGDWTVRVNLPLHLTDVATLTAVAALWRPRPLLVELVFLWGLTAALAAVLTPDLDPDLPALFAVTFYVTHGGAVAAACLLVPGRRLPVRPGAARRVFALTAALAVVAGAADLLTGGNYLFLRRPPSSGSLLDLMGPWPWYIVAAAALALALFLALEALAGTLSARAAGPSGTRGPTTAR